MEAQLEVVGPKALELLLARGLRLHTLPAVAAEVLTLTNCESVDTRALKDCIERDPALTAKLLRVVNSSLFGLSSQVTDLNQALALLGTKPLKLLVLGFSLPERLFLEVAGTELEWYWNTTLARAVAARELCKKYSLAISDDAFIAGLLQDIGILVLLDQLRAPYARLVTTSREERIDLSQVERESLGFNHRQVSSRLLSRWKIPRTLVLAISEQKTGRALAARQNEQAELARMLQLAEMFAQLVAQKRIDVLPDLLAMGELYCGMTKEDMNELVSVLQEKVFQLADVLSLSLPDEQDYMQVVTEAHQRLAETAEDVASALLNTEESAEVSSAVQELRETIVELSETGEELEEISAAEDSVTDAISSTIETSSTDPVFSNKTLTQKSREQIARAVSECRTRRAPLSAMLLEETYRGAGLDPLLIEQTFVAAVKSIDHHPKLIERLGDNAWMVLLADCERSEAVRLAEALRGEIRQTIVELGQLEAATLGISIGIASVALVSKNFPPQDLLDAAQRCLLAAHETQGQLIKSVEVY